MKPLLLLSLLTAAFALALALLPDPEAVLKRRAIETARREATTHREIAAKRAAHEGNAHD